MTMQIFALRQLAGAGVLLLPLTVHAQALTTLHSFTGGTDGAHPSAGLIYQNGLLYGTTSAGGDSACAPHQAGCGTVFAIDPATETETVLYRFQSAADGTTPNAGLISRNGSLYGTTFSGGATESCLPPRPIGRGCGSIFKIDLATGAEKVVYSFPTDGTDGAEPWDLSYRGGSLYGTTNAGGSAGYAGYGVVFMFNLTTGTETVLHDFPASKNDGARPHGPLAYHAGSLYGTTQGGGIANGEVFKIDAATGAEQVLYRFKGDFTDGGQPAAGLIYLDGFLYGTTLFGGAGGSPNCVTDMLSICGTVFKVNATTGVETVLHSFAYVDGSQPSAGLVFHDGALFGTTSVGGSFGFGTAFKLNLATGSETLLHSFTAGTDGATPYAGLLYHNGKLYGTTSGGGTSNQGTVFSLTP